MRRFGLSFILAGVAVLGCCLGGRLSAQVLGGWGFAIENGDVNGDQDRDLSDGVYILGHLYLGGPEPVPLARCGLARSSVANGDANADGTLDLSDAVRLLGWLFVSGDAPAPACGTGTGGGHVPRIAPPGSHAFGNTLAGWTEAYWRWNFATGADPAQSLVGRVKLLPIPTPNQVGGSGTPDDPAILQGSIEVTLPPGTPFVIPQFAWISEKYDPALGIPDDPPLPDDALLAGVSPNLTIDGAVVVSDANERDFYVPATSFDPLVVYPAPSSYGSIAAHAFQGCAIVSPPLSVGEHVMKLHEPYILRDVLGFSVGVVYDNTWKITVTSD